jgi:hypothetical protein
MLTSYACIGTPFQVVPFYDCVLTYHVCRYGSWNDIASFKKYVQTAHTRFGKNIWIPELGVTTASHPSQGQVKNFMMEVFAWLESQSYVERAAWFGKLTTMHILSTANLTPTFQDLSSPTTLLITSLPV